MKLNPLTHPLLNSLRLSFLAAMIGSIIATASAQGDLDPTFDAGSILNEIAEGSVHASLIDGDGKHLIAGAFTSVDGVMRGNLARLNAEGSLDLTFNTGDGANGAIHTMVFDSSGRILIAGEFTTFDGFPRPRIARLTPTGELDETFDPGSGFDGAVYSIAVNDFTIYAGGEFTTYSGSVRSNLAVLDDDGTLADTSLNEGANAAVRALSINSETYTLYVGGDFTLIGGVNRDYFAQISMLSGTITGSDLLLNGVVRTIAHQTNSSSQSSTVTVYLGGDFTSIGGVARGRFAAISSGFGDSLSVNPLFNFWLDAPCRTIHVPDGTTVLIGGDFSAVNGQSRSHFAALSSISINQETSSLSYWTLDDGYGEFGPDASVFTLGQDALGRPVLGGLFNGFPSMPRNAYLRLQGEAGSLPPAIPSSVSAIPLSDTQIFISWTGSEFASTYTLESSPDGIASWGQIYKGEASTFTDTGLTAETQRYYRIQAANYNGPSDFSPSVSSSTNPAPWEGSGSLLEAFPPGSLNGAVSSALRQQDGKIIIAGAFTSVLGSPRKHIARLHPDLTLDADFNPGASTNAPITKVEAGPNGGIYIFGNFTTVASLPRTRVARLKSTGELDAAFNTGNAWTFAKGIQALPDGKLIIYGNFSTFFGAPRDNIARLNLDGSIDTSFVATPGSQINALAMQPAGELLLGGWFRTINGQAAQYFARLTADGLLDPSFSGTASRPSISMIVSLPNGKHLASGSFTTISGVARKYLARLKEDGSVDDTFDPGSSANTSGLLLFPQADGKLIVAGTFTSFANTTRWKLARLHADGSLDSTFTVEAGPGNGTIQTVLTLPDGSILVGGNFSTFAASNRSYLVQIKGDTYEKAPVTPQDLIGTALSSSSIVLSWSELPHVFSWTIERSPAGGGAWQQIASLPWGFTTFTDSELPVNTAFDYRIRASNTRGESPDSTVATAKTLSAFDQWKLDRHFSPGTPDDFDANGNGIGLFMTYALDLDTGTSSHHAVPSAQVVGDFLVMSYQRHRSELDYVVEASEDLVHWSHLRVNQGIGSYPIAWTPIDGEPQLFLRLRITTRETE